MKIAHLLLLLALSLPLSGYAEPTDGSPQQVYDAMRQAENMYNLETASGQCPTNDRSGGGFWGACVTENSKNEFRLREVLRFRADAGDPVAMFYQGVMLTQSGARRHDTEIGIKARKEAYEMALGYYKKACAAAISEACWNVADRLHLPEFHISARVRIGTLPPRTRSDQNHYRSPCSRWPQTVCLGVYRNH